MTNNIDRAAEVIGGWIDAYLPHSEDNFGADEDIARALAEAGLLAPDLPEPNDPDASFVPGGEGWFFDGPEGPVVRAIRGAIVWVQGINHGGLTPEQTRALADALYAAADHAEGVGRADS